MTAIEITIIVILSVLISLIAGLAILAFNILSKTELSKVEKLKLIKARYGGYTLRDRIKDQKQNIRKNFLGEGRTT
jgi:hypothetical protein